MVNIPERSTCETQPSSQSAATETRSWDFRPARGTNSNIFHCKASSSSIDRLLLKRSARAHQAPPNHLTESNSVSVSEAAWQTLYPSPLLYSCHLNTAIVWLIRMVSRESRRVIYFVSVLSLCPSQTLACGLLKVILSQTSSPQVSLCPAQKRFTWCDNNWISTIMGWKKVRTWWEGGRESELCGWAGDSERVNRNENEN